MTKRRNRYIIYVVKYLIGKLDESQGHKAMGLKQFLLCLPGYNFKLQPVFLSKITEVIPMKFLKSAAAVLLSVCTVLGATVVASAEDILTLSNNGTETVYAADNIVIDGADVTLTLDNATVGGTGSAIVIKNNSNVKLELVGDSKVTGDAAEVSCGIYVEYGSSLTVSGSGTLTVTGGKYGAAIGSYGTERNLPENERINCGDITVAGGTVYAYGGEKGAGIGSGNHVDGGNITISGGTVYAFGNSGGAGIGSGYGTSGGAAPVAAVGDYDAGHISITGGTVYAAAFNMDFSSFDYMDPSTYDSGNDTFAAGIGGGYGACAGDIQITGGSVTAVGSCGGAGIGSGRGTSKGSKYDADAFKVNIFIGGDAEVVAVATDDDRSGASQGGGAAIGSGRGTHTGGKIDITDNAKITAVAPPNTYAIGSGSSKNPVDGSAPVSQRITVTDGVTLYAAAQGISALESTAAVFECSANIAYDNELTSQTAVLGTKEYTVPANYTSVWANTADAELPSTVETVNVNVITPKRMSIRLQDGTVLKSGDSFTAETEKEIKFRMCSDNWDNDTYDDNGNGLCGTVVYTFVVTRSVAKRTYVDETHALMMPVSDPALRTDTNFFFMAYRFYNSNGNYDKQTGIVGVVNTPLESLSVNLPLGSTVVADGYKAMNCVTSASILIETAEDKSICYTDYYWNY